MAVAQTRKQTETTDDDGWVSLSEAARLLEETRQMVLQRAVGGEIVAKRIAGRTVVTRESVEKVLAQKAEPASKSR